MRTSSHSDHRPAPGRQPFELDAGHHRDLAQVGDAGVFGLADSQWLTALRWTCTAVASCICERPAWRRARRIREGCVIDGLPGPSAGSTWLPLMLPELTSRLEFNTRCPISGSGLLRWSPAGACSAGNPLPIVTQQRGAHALFTPMGISGILAPADKEVGFLDVLANAPRKAQTRRPASTPLACRGCSICKVPSRPASAGLVFCADGGCPERREIRLRQRAAASGREASGFATGGHATSADRDRPSPPETRARQQQRQRADRIAPRQRRNRSPARHRRRSPAGARAACPACGRRAAS